MNKPIKIFFLAANPEDTNPLRLDEEMRGIDQALRQAEFRDKFDVRQHWAIRVTDLQGYLLRHKPDIVHFSGHGSTASEIILEDNEGNSHPVSIRALSQLFSVLKGNIRCVVLNTCYSEQQAQAIAKHIDCVTGMSKAIGDAAAISFSIAFYQALAFGKDIKTAFDLGCLQIDLENLNEQDTPKLIAININPSEIVFTNKLLDISNDQKDMIRKNEIGLPNIKQKAKNSQGQVIQAGRDVIIQQHSPTRSLNKRFIGWVGIMFSVLAIIAFILLGYNTEHINLFSKPLEVELAFYALNEKPNNTYELGSLLGKGTPQFLGLDKKIAEIKGVPTVFSKEQSQMRIKLNRKGYVYVFHFDTTFTEVRQLFPADEILETNPIPSDGWLELPSTDSAWHFDNKPGLEIFLVYASSKESNNIRNKIVKIIDQAKTSSAGLEITLQRLKHEFETFAPCNPTKSGEFVHNLTGVIPASVKTFAFQAKDRRSALIYQFVYHRNDR